MIVTDFIARPIGFKINFDNRIGLLRKWETDSIVFVELFCEFRDNFVILRTTM